MLGIVVILLVSWGLLHFIAGKDLRVLGLTPTPQRMLQFAAGFLLFCVLTGLTIVTDTWVYKIQWQRSEYGLSHFAWGLLYYLKSAMTEDLVFRGALLYLLIQRLGGVKAMLVSSLAFGIYHWFSFGMLSGELRVVPLIYVMLLTGSVGFSWAYSYVKTQSVLMPLAMHTASNFILSFFYQNQPYGQMLYSEMSREPLSEGLNLLYLMIKLIAVPVITVLVVRQWFAKKQSL